MSPRGVRNFWIELDVDGKKTRVATGPKSSSGGFSAMIRMRNQGSVDLGVRIRGYLSSDTDELVLVAENPLRLKQRILKKTKR